jgi:hypothetical protein
MHEIEPYYRWRDDYIAAEDEHSPFYSTEYNEFEFDKQLYNLPDPPAVGFVRIQHAVP